MLQESSTPLLAAIVLNSLWVSSGKESALLEELSEQFPLCFKSVFILVRVRNASPFIHFQQLCFMSSVPLFCTFTELTSLPIPQLSRYVRHAGQCLAESWLSLRS